MKETSSYTELYGEGFEERPTQLETQTEDPPRPSLFREGEHHWFKFSRDYISFDDRMLFNVSSDEVQWMIL